MVTFRQKWNIKSKENVFIYCEHVRKFYCKWSLKYLKKKLYLMNNTDTVFLVYTLHKLQETHESSASFC